MANIRKFDEDETLDKILDVFWRRGYEATSLDDLVAATNVKRQSLYNAFGNKDDMFSESCRRYQSRFETLFDTPPGTDVPVRDRLREILEAMGHSITDPASPNGCLMVNAAVEFGDRETSEINALVRERVTAFQNKFEGIIVAAQRSGEIDAERNPRAIAQFLVASLAALAVRYRPMRDRAQAENTSTEAPRVLA